MATYLLSPLLFNCFIDRVFMTPGGWRNECTTTELGTVLVVYSEGTVHHRQPEHSVSWLTFPGCRICQLAASHGERTGQSMPTKGHDNQCYQNKDNDTMTVSARMMNARKQSLWGGTHWRLWRSNFSYLGNEVGKNTIVGGDVGTRLEKASITVYQRWRRRFFGAEVSAREPSCMSSEWWCCLCSSTDQKLGCGTTQA